MDLLGGTINHLNFDITTWFILIIIFLISYHFISRQPWKNPPPGPPILPVIGSLPFMGADPDFMKIFGRMKAKYGPVWMAQMGQNRTVVLSEYKLIHEALVKNALNGRPQGLIGLEFIKPAVSTTNGETWRHGRAFMVSVLKDLGLGKRTMESYIHDEIDHMLNEIRQKENTAFDVRHLLKQAFANIISLFAFSYRGDYADPEFIKRLRWAAEQLENFGNDNPLNAFPFLKHLPGDLFKYKRNRTLADRMDKFYQSCIDDHKEDLSETGSPRDFIEAYLLEMKKQQSKSNQFTDEHLMGHVAELFLGGTDTVSNTFAWAILYLMSSPQIQSKLYDEIYRVIGDRPPTFKDRLDMPYTEACISETQRLSMVLPLGVPHNTLEDVTVGGYTIPKHTMVLVDFPSVFMDPEIWPEPHKFRPSRFLDSEGGYRKRDEFIPFSLGKRSCLGENLAKMEMFLFLVTLVQKFSLHIPDGEAAPETSGLLGFSYSLKPFTVVFKPRQ